MHIIFIKRIYDEASENDGYRILVDRIWPRGISKERAKLDEWNKNIAPSTKLRKWFGHNEDRFDEFARRYEGELSEVWVDLGRIVDIARNEKVCLLYSARNKVFNQAVVLQQVLESTMAQGK
ncbi:MAG: DUF488 family protein [Saprospiraceae bacterium]|nr:DUF488 family protein [Saprospiraceae bacterium]